MRRVTWLGAARSCVAGAMVWGAMPAVAAAQDAAAPGTAASDVWSRVPASMHEALERITASSLRGDLSFIAGDLLAGRGTPSPGQEIAAYYIAAQFRGAGLTPVGDDEYFQTANWQMLGRGPAEFSAKITTGDRSLPLVYEQTSILSDAEISAAGAGLVRLAAAQPEAVDAMDAAALKGAIVLTDLSNYQTAPRESQREAFVAMRALLAKLEEAGVAAVITVDRTSETGSGFASGDLVDPEAGQPGRRGFQINPPLLCSHDPAVAALFDSLPNGPVEGGRVDLVLGPMQAQPVKLRNVIGMLPGSDPTRRDEYVMVTAHYDHLGVATPVDGDAIYNGANDDGSGTVSVIALARALGSLPPESRPKRSVLFMTVFGEERGLLGSNYYVQHPIFPLAKIVGDINLEQVGRTDSTEGPQIKRASLTGFAYSTLTDSFVEAGKALGVDVYDHPQNSESFFGRSDNIAFAAAGVPAHTLCVAYVYPDYHGPGDHWEKIDYENMAHIDRMMALGLFLLADAPDAPVWHGDHPRTGRYVEAWKQLRAPPEP